MVLSKSQAQPKGKEESEKRIFKDSISSNKKEFSKIMPLESSHYGLFGVLNGLGYLQLIYKIPSDLLQGTLCIVPLKNRKSRAVFLNKVSAPKYICKPVLEIYETLPSELFSLYEWVSHYYLMPLGHTILKLHSKNAWESHSTTPKVRKSSYLHKTETHTLNSLTPQQQLIFETILKDPKVYLLHGQTGSGKTEIYLHLAKHMESQGLQTLILVPEISLTPQLYQRFEGIFPGSVAMLHSGMTPAEYFLNWASIESKPVILGVRSAIFAPIQRLGLIIVDEEHESSYKNENFPFYHARDIAVLRSHLKKIPCLLGSATPSLESYVNTQEGRYQLLELSQRYSTQNVEFQFVDAKKYLLHLKNFTHKKTVSGVPFQGHSLSSPVFQEIAEALDQQKQFIIVMNRRGFASYQMCLDCGTAFTCENCSATTTLHYNGQKEICHYCGWNQDRRKKCNSCGSVHMTFMGLGTENIQKELEKVFPETVIQRVDGDTPKSKLWSIFKDFREGKIQGLVGTQMLSKGHDFPNVTLIILLYIEDQLFLPDYRSVEKTHQLFIQASGRVGRGEHPGKVLVQSLASCEWFQSKTEESKIPLFLKETADLRKLTQQPPYVRHILLEVQSLDRQKALQESEDIIQSLFVFWKDQKIEPHQIRCVGPLPAVIEKISKKYRFHISLMFQKSIHPRQIIPSKIIDSSNKIIDSSETIRIDVDPIHLF